MARPKAEENINDPNNNNNNNNNNSNKVIIILKYIAKIFISILDEILHNKFVQLCIFMFIMFKFGNRFFRNNKIGIFINGTDNFYHEIKKK